MSATLVSDRGQLYRSPEPPTMIDSCFRCFDYHDVELAKPRLAIADQVVWDFTREGLDAGLDLLHTDIKLRHAQRVALGFEPAAAG